ncbi:MAG TPA: hypothetical protein VFP97_00695 [Chitinophagaceae bacterium]|nr:hypothetical protein [Chitinophagaceae bacterium]
MPTTTCQIAGNVYQLDYTKLNSKRGTYYFGKIHSDPVTGFAFTVLTAGGHEFDDNREPIHRQEAIVNAIRTYEAGIAV